MHRIRTWAALAASLATAALTALALAAPAGATISPTVRRPFVAVSSYTVLPARSTMALVGEPGRYAISVLTVRDRMSDSDHTRGGQPPTMKECYT
jgi:hypothetical protein